MPMVKICECECECESERNTKARVREKMIEYSRSGEINNGLYLAIREYPELLQDIDETQFAHTPMHEAAASGQTSFAIEIMNLMPSFGKKLNPLGLSPLHVAIETGHTDTALALVKLDKQLVLVKGKGGLTPLHFAARTHLIYADDYACLDSFLVGLLLACPRSIDVLSNKLQTAIHVASENKRFEAVHLLVNWLITKQRESVLSWKDEEGNTALHIAAQHDCPQGLLKLVVNLVKINKKNKYGQTPLDLANKEEVKQVLREAGGRRGQDLGPKPSKVDYLLQKYSNGCAEGMMRAYYFLIKEMTMEMRNTILVIEVLIATATYQGVLQPPGGVYSAEGTAAVARLNDDGKHLPGRMVMGRSHYSYFMLTNTLAFILSNVIIVFVLPARYFTLIVQASLLFMCFGYLLGLKFISESNIFSKIMFVACCCTIVVAFLFRIAYYLVKALYHGDVWWLRRLSVMVSNNYDRFYTKSRSDRHTRSSISSSARELRNMSLISRMRKQYELMLKD